MNQHAVVIRLAPGMRRCLIAYALAIASFLSLLGITAAAHGSPGGAAVAAAALVRISVTAWRWSSLAVTVEGDHPVVRQFLTTRRIPRSDVIAFRAGGRRREAPGVAVRAVLRDGSTVVLGATGWYFRSTADVEAACTELEAWRRTG